MVCAPTVAFRSLVLAVSLIAPSSPANAWTPYGHMVIAATAYDQLDPPVRQRVDDLIRLNRFYPDWIKNVPAADMAKVAFVKAATWADEIKGDHDYHDDEVTGPEANLNTGYDSDWARHAYWHYINVPFSPDGVDTVQPASPNVLTQIDRFRKVLASDAPDPLKSYDLVWLLHLVGDVHQPLHTTARFTIDLPGGDRGGNSVTVCPTNGDCTNLHAYWDGLLGDTDQKFMVTTADAARAIDAAKALPTPASSRVAVSSATEWVDESFWMARSVVYADPVGVGKGPFLLLSTYEDQARISAQQQAAIAAARLADLINADLR